MRPTTQQRVLDMSAELFNRYGIEAVSVGQISEALKISPGNLTYHFKRKSHLIAGHISVFERELLKRVEAIPDFSDAKSFCRAYCDMMRLTLRYRFLFIGANYIIQSDLVPAAKYERLIEATKHNIIRQMKRLIADGYMKPIQDPYSIEMLVDSMWWQWLGWLLVMQITPATRRVTDSQRVAEVVLHLFFLSHHYVDQKFFSDVHAELKKMARQST